MFSKKCTLVIFLASVLGSYSLTAQIKKGDNTIIDRQKQIPVLCYHHIKASIEGHTFAYTISTGQFRTHLKMLADSGFHTILPNQLYNYLTAGVSLPEKPIMITFDDTNEEHFSTAAPLLESFGFKGVFFIMTIPIGKQGYMTSRQIKQLADDGHAIENHSRDHPDMRKLPAADWNIQINQTKQELEQIIGKPVLYFAYPYGAWNESAIPELKKRDIRAAFQLSDRESINEPLYTIRRLMVPGNWSAIALYKQIQATFK